MSSSQAEARALRTVEPKYAFPSPPPDQGNTRMELSGGMRASGLLIAMGACLSPRLLIAG